MRALWLTLLLGVTLFGAPRLQWYGDYAKAHQEALKYKRALMVLVVKPHDPLTQRIVRDVLFNRNYLTALQERVVAVMVTYEGRASYPIENYYTTQFPALFVVDPLREVAIVPPLYGEEITPEALRSVLQQLQTKPTL